MFEFLTGNKDFSYRFFLSFFKNILLDFDPVEEVNMQSAV